MTGDTPFPAPEPAPASPFAIAPRRRGRTLWIVALIAFAVGIVAMYYLLPMIDRWRTPATTAPAAVVEAPAAPSPTQPSITAAAPVTLDGLAAREAMLDAQLRDIEGRIAATDAAARAAAGYARRAEGLMVAFAARRALDRGLQLGYVEGQLRDRFGADQPEAVAAVTAAARNRVTLGELQEGFSRIAPTLTSGTLDEGFFSSVWREVSTLVILRRDTTPSSRADDRLARARAALDGGNVEAALAEVARMPGAADATSWIEAAKRYIDARRALNTLELAAIDGRPDRAATPTTPAPAQTPAPTPAPAAADPAAPNPAGQLPGI